MSLFTDLSWRAILYPLGFLSSICFTGRFLIQWKASETAKKSVVMPLFWQLSFIGNLLLALHSIIQVQWQVCVVQGCNAVISWRNLNLMKSTDNQYSIKTVYGAFFGVIISSILIFILQSYWFFDGHFEWIRAPSLPWSYPKSMNENAHLSLFWDTLGSIGVFLFASRFWVQWWLTEKHQLSLLSPLFWWMSLIGALFSLVYFFQIGDIVNAIGPAFGLVPYVRNLILLKKK